MPHPLPAALGSLGAAASSLRREPYTSQYVPLVVWQITVYHTTSHSPRRRTAQKIAINGTTTNLVLLLMSAGIESRKLKACSWLDPADREDPSLRTSDGSFFRTLLVQRRNLDRKVKQQCGSCTCLDDAITRGQLSFAER
ncbi:hypothetical protein N431DRAFT_241674 [Stipitochalara longipes BDJ]|nr:hypothetical protein N431DRAFT_241674 [Stipitochalara longipes BDJ]